MFAWLRHLLTHLSWLGASAPTLAATLSRRRDRLRFCLGTASPLRLSSSLPISLPYRHHCPIALSTERIYTHSVSMRQGWCSRSLLNK
jgi:hypothetical protein